MEMVSHFYLDSKENFPVENISIQHGDIAIAPPIPDHVEPQQPAKKPTRQWAAWTRQEEESFFTALRQVGKNFEKITRRVQSKNKDQVRHYYYRLVRRMNKLLGPAFCLDAKNSKDTNAAMLRWWSLLEKYSCKASKLHLKPRRFKIFIEALENQLIKDRKKNVRKRPSQVENSSLTASSTVTSQGRNFGNETRTVKLVLVDSQNLQKLGAGKGSVKRNVNIGVIRSNRGDSTVMKPPRQRRKQGGSTSAAAYKKWEKAAMAGVSLVADAAEHLERATSDKEVIHDQTIAETNSHEPTAKDLPSLPVLSQNPNIASNSHANMKLKLQLFPIDDGTRRALEMDNHNPHLELTLSTRKKISSVLEHLNRKWGSSSVASGELLLFPYNAQRERLAGYQKWKQDSIVCAADVYSSIGSPSIFRLRYGWFSNDELASLSFQAPSSSSSIPTRVENERRELVDSVPESHKQMDILSNEVSGYVEPLDPAASDDRMDLRQFSDAEDLRMSNGMALSAGEWADSLTNISVGDLLAEVPNEAVPNCTETPAAEMDHCLLQMPFSCDSFDAAIAAHISKHQTKSVYQPTVASHASSIWDAEETCDAFSFQRNHTQNQRISNSVTCKKTDSMICGAFIEEPVDYPADENPMDTPSPDPLIEDNSPKDFIGLTDIYWPESLGPLDLDMPATKYHAEEFMLTDSLSGLNHLIASSLDAFQNCSFGLDRKESTLAAVDAGESSSLLSNFKTEGDL